MDVAILTIDYAQYLMPAEQAEQVQALLLQHAWTTDGSYEPVELPPCRMFPKWCTVSYRYRWRGKAVAQPHVKRLVLGTDQLLVPLPRRAPIDPLGLLDD